VAFLKQEATSPQKPTKLKGGREKVVARSSSNSKEISLATQKTWSGKKVQKKPNSSQSSIYMALAPQKAGPQSAGKQPKK
jgi:hypothetical protein